MILVFIIFFLSAHIVYGKYVSIDKINMKFRIATPIFIVDGKDITYINEKNNVGYYEFSVKNFNETNVSEIGFLYTIEIISNTNEEIQFELYNNEEQLIELQNLKTQEFFNPANQKKEDNYKLKIIYDIAKGNKEKNIFEEVQIKIHSEQKNI